ncbi:hypothetical protein [Micromonospora thermarum]|uniref:Uncharacterized protein n=1 Tax=Micromonospora thermarum TaxID=2720024 RepID=A0ABX0Z0R8_9ACTN|nr:hypothetical protein [Micromonospora thermarum]NJP31093.1 hypothetical protein [Micromonospora thermarum]
MSRFVVLARRAAAIAALAVLVLGAHDERRGEAGAPPPPSPAPASATP